LMAALLGFTSPLIAEFFNEPVLIPLARVLALSFIVNAIGAIHMTLYRKHLDFKILMKIGIISTIVSGLVAIIFAYNGYGVWALAYQTITKSVVTTTLLWVISSWRPIFSFSILSLRQLFSFGGYLTLSAILDVAFNQIYFLLIGKFFGVRDLGFYARAENTKQIPINFLSGTLQRVAFPIFSATAHDEVKLRAGVRLAIRGIMLLNVPMVLGLMATSESFIPVVFGEKWLPAVPYLQILCLAGVFWPLAVINLNVLMALGHSDLFFKLEIVKKVLGVLFIVVGISYGIIGLAWSQVASGIAGFFINSYYTGRFLGYGARKQFIDFAPTLLIAIVMAIIVYVAGNAFLEKSFTTLCVQVFIGVGVYVIISLLVRLTALHDVIVLFSSKKP